MVFMTEESFMFRGHFYGHFERDKAPLPEKLCDGFPDGMAYALVGEDGSHVGLYPQATAGYIAKIPIQNGTIHFDDESKQVLGIAYLDGKVTFIGAGDHVEIWDRECMDRIEDELIKRYPKILAELGI